MIVVNEIESHVWRFANLTSNRFLEESFDEALEQWEAGNPVEAEQRLRGVLKVCPDHLDAIHHLAIILRETGREFEARLCAQEAARLGLNAIPSRFCWLVDRLSWGTLENRPFMRAYHSQAVLHMRTGDLPGAVEILARLMSVDPNDHLGCRYLLLDCYLLQSAWASLFELAVDCSEDSSPDFLYSPALAHFSCGSGAKGMERLARGVTAFPLVAKELLKNRHMRPVSAFPGTIEHGGADQAYDYWSRVGRLWRKNKEAMAALRELTS